MADKLISLDNLQEYKTYADAKYQNKLIAGSNIDINGNVISKKGAPTFSGALLSGNVSVPSETLTKVGEVTLQPGVYYLTYTCTFPTNSGDTGYRQCGFSTSDSDLAAFGWAYIDNQNGLAINAQTMVNAIFEVSATDYPNGRTFYFLAKQKSNSSIDAYPRAYYFKF